MDVYCIIYSSSRSRILLPGILYRIIVVPLHLLFILLKHSVFMYFTITRISLSYCRHIIRDVIIIFPLFLQYVLLRGTEYV